MKHIPNKLVAIVTLAAWALVFILSFINGFLYGSPPVDSILPSAVAALIGWFAFIVTIFAVVKLYFSPSGSSQNAPSLTQY